MSGFLALLDDVALIARAAAASVDDVAAAALKAGTKSAGVVIDDTAVTPTYVAGFSPERELPMIYQIAKGSLRNKLLILMPMAIALKTFAPGLIPALLLVGGLYLCFEGAEKVWHMLHADQHADDGAVMLEEQNVAQAIKTDFILSAEIVTITLGALPPQGFWFDIAALTVVCIVITFAVYGLVALIVKADDVGLYLHRTAKVAAVRALGRATVRTMPVVLSILSTVGTLAMLWVGGSLILHSLHSYHIEYLAFVSEWAAMLAAVLQNPSGFALWGAHAILDGILGLILGLSILGIINLGNRARG